MSNETIEVQAVTPEVDAAPAAVSALPELRRDQQAMALVSSYVPWAASAGMIPVPTVDLAALLGLQLRMLAKLAKLYEVPFLENGVKSTVSAMLGTVLASSAGASLGSLIKAVPVVGTYIGFAAAPGAFAAATYAIGRVFVTHFEAGGTFLNFDPKKTRDYFTAEFEKAKAAPAA
jgi:uncharacterized protein (DUF697 family)